MKGILAIIIILFITYCTVLVIGVLVAVLISCFETLKNRKGGKPVDVELALQTDP
jgi:MFS superfamily sulfate permease-like transporter